MAISSVSQHLASRHRKIMQILEGTKWIQRLVISRTLIRI